MTYEDMPSTEGDSNPVVFVDQGHVRTTSRDVATNFGKHHWHVMRTIHGLLEAVPAFSQSTFGLAEYVDEQGKRRPAYSMDRDGVTMVAMASISYPLHPLRCHRMAPIRMPLAGPAIHGHDIPGAALKDAHHTPGPRRLGVYQDADGG